MTDRQAAPTWPELTDAAGYQWSLDGPFNRAHHYLLICKGPDDLVFYLPQLEAGGIAALPPAADRLEIIRQLREALRAFVNASALPADTPTETAPK